MLCSCAVSTAAVIGVAPWSGYFELIKVTTSHAVKIDIYIFIAAPSCQNKWLNMGCQVIKFYIPQVVTIISIIKQSEP